MTLTPEVFNLVVKEAVEQLRSIQAELTVLRNEQQEMRVSTAKDVAVAQEQIQALQGHVKTLTHKIEDRARNTTAIVVALIGSLTSLVTSLIAILKP